MTIQLLILPLKRQPDIGIIGKGNLYLWKEEGLLVIILREHSVAYQLELIPEVVAYARNDHLDFTIPYEWQGTQHEYRPDYLVYLKTEKGNIIKVILEIKGFETEKDRQKQIAAKRWVRAVNHHGEFGRWVFLVCKEPRQLRETLNLHMLSQWT